MKANVYQFVSYGWIGKCFSMNSSLAGQETKLMNSVEMQLVSTAWGEIKAGQAPMEQPIKHKRM